MFLWLVLRRFVRNLVFGCEWLLNFWSCCIWYGMILWCLVKFCNCMFVVMVKLFIIFIMWWCDLRMVLIVVCWLVGGVVRRFCVLWLVWKFWDVLSGVIVCWWVIFWVWLVLLIEYQVILIWMIFFYLSVGVWFGIFLKILIDD